MHNSYLRLVRSAPAAEALLKGLQDAPRIINGVWRVPVDAVDGATNSPLTLIESYPDLPMEKVFPRSDVPGPAQLFARTCGRGRVVYFPWDVDRTFWEVLCVDHGKLLANAVEWVTNEEPLVTVSGPGMLDVTIWRQRDSMTVHLVNLTNPMTMKGPFRELIPVGEQKVHVRFPEKAKIASVRLLAAQATPKMVKSDRHLTVNVPSILDHEVVAIEFAGNSLP
jgi:hypothetical protein